MSTKSAQRIRLSLLVVAFLVLEFATGSPAPAQAPDLPCVLLKNDNVMYGQAFQVGEFVLVHTREGGEVKLPRTSVACWAGSLQDLYQFRVDQRNSSDLRDLLRDVDWCIKNDLYEFAANDLTTINQLQPDHPDAARLTERLRRLTRDMVKTASPTSPGVEAPASTTTTTPAAITQAGFAAGPAVDSSDPVMLQGFVRQVQPMLINRCGNCHSQGSGRKWSLSLPTPGTRPSSQSTRENLAATLPFIQSTSAETCELYLKATTAHGGVDAPLDVRTYKATEFFRLWLAHSLQVGLQEVGAQDSHVEQVSAPADLPQPPPLDLVPQQTQSEPNVHPQPTASPNQQADQPARLPQVDNPFDPDIFNRRFHLKTTGKD
jgi:hypothetical protein